MIKILIYFFVGAVIGWIIASLFSPSRNADTDDAIPRLITEIHVLQHENAILREKNAKLREENEKLREKGE